MATRSWKVPRAVGFGAGLLSLALVIFSAVGAVWGHFRPTLTGRAVEGGWAIDYLGDAQFLAYAWFATLTGALSVALGTWAYVKGQDCRGVGMQVWAGIVAFAGAVAFFVMGSVTAAHIPEAPADIVAFAPSFQPGVAWAVGPLMAMLAYWSSAFVSADSDWGQVDTADTEDTAVES